MPFSRPPEPPIPSGSLDHEADWVSVLDAFRDLTTEHQALVVRDFGRWLMKLRSSDLRHLQSRELVLSTIIARRQSVLKDT